MIRYENPGLAVWIAYSAPPRARWFDYRRGRIVVKSPDQEVLRKMWMLAQRLDAKVQADEGELYGGRGEVTA